MFNIIRAALISVSLLSPVASAVYPDTMLVVRVYKDIDTIILENYAGFRYEYEGSEDWCVGDYASVIVDSNGTDKVFDDKILDAQYSIFFERN